MSRSNLVKYSLAIASILLVLNAITPSSLAADYGKIGVKTGDTAEYSEVSDIETWNRVVVLFANVTPPLVEISTSYYANTTKVAGYASTQNVSQWISGYYLIAANLAQNDPFYAGQTKTINETISMTVLGQTRNVNHLKYNGGSLDLYWDKETGLLVKANYVTSPEWVNVTLTSTTVFRSDMTLILVAGGVLAVLVIAAIVIILRRRRK